MSDSLRPHESQHARPPCPSPTPGVYPNSRPLSWWCHPATSSSVVPFSSCPQSLPASGSFPISQLFTWGGICTRAGLEETQRKWWMGHVIEKTLFLLSKTSLLSIQSIHPNQSQLSWVLVILSNRILYQQNTNLWLKLQTRVMSE